MRECFNCEDGKDTDTDKDTSFYKQPPCHEKKSEKDRLESHDISETLEQPNLQKAACLCIGSTVYVANEEAMG